MNAVLNNSEVVGQGNPDMGKLLIPQRTFLNLIREKGLLVLQSLGIPMTWFWMHLHLAFVSVTSILLDGKSCGCERIDSTKSKAPRAGGYRLSEEVTPIGSRVYCSP